MILENQLISIILPTYNRGRIIAQSIQSVLEQTYSEIELIIIDDDSNDNTEELIKAFHDSKIKYYKNECNKGANYSRNRGILLARGNYIAFIDSDNIWKKDKLEKQIDVFENSSDDISIVYSGFNQILGDKSIYIPSPNIAIEDKEQNILNILFEKNIIDTNTVMVKKEIFDHVGLFDESMPRLQDWEMFFRAIYVGKYKVKFIDEALVDGYIQSDSISSNNKSYILARLIFFEKYKDAIIQNGYTGMIINDIMQFSCSEISSYIRIDEIRKILQEDYECLIEGLIYCIDKEKQKKTKFECYYQALNQWLILKQNNKSIDKFLYCKGYRTIAIYGMGELGKRLFDEISNTDIKVKYVIDKTYTSNSINIEVINYSDYFEIVDAIVVTAIGDFEQIKSELLKKTEYPIISLQEILREMCLD